MVTTITRSGRIVSGGGTAHPDNVNVSTNPHAHRRDCRKHLAFGVRQRSIIVRAT